MKHYLLHTRPTVYEAQALSGDDECLRNPTTIQDLVDIFKLFPARIRADEGRSAFLAAPSNARTECVLHIREMALQLQQDGVSSYAGGSQLAFPTLRQPTWPTFHDPQELSDDNLCLRKPETTEGLLEILNLLPSMLDEAERRSVYRGELCGARAECVAHLRELALQLQQAGVTAYAGVS